MASSQQAYMWGTTPYTRTPPPSSSRLTTTRSESLLPLGGKEADSYCFSLTLYRRRAWTHPLFDYLGDRAWLPTGKHTEAAVANDSIVSKTSKKASPKKAGKSRARKEPKTERRRARLADVTT